MSVFRTILGRIDDLTAKAEDTLVAYLHGAISVMVILAVILRYVFNNPLTWGEELIVALLTWMVFLGAAAAIIVDDVLLFPPVWIWVLAVLQPLSLYRYES